MHVGHRPSSTAKLGSSEVTESEIPCYRMQISVSNGVITELFEALDTNGDGLISFEEWTDNFTLYIDALIKHSEEEQAGAPGVAISPPRQLQQVDISPRSSSWSSPTGLTLPPLPSAGKSASSIPSPSSSVGTRGVLGRLRKPPRLSSESYARLTQSEKRVSTSGKAPGSIKRTLSRDQLAGGPPGSQGQSGAGAGLNRRRATANGPLEAVSVAGSRRPYTPSRPPDRSSVATPNNKQSVMVRGHRGLNWRSQHSAFEGELVRADTIKVRAS